MFMFYWPDNKY